MQNNTNQRRRGFTIIELSIVMVFVSLLMLAVVAVTIYAGKAYTKGVTLKTLNQVGREVTGSMRRDIASAPKPGLVQFVSGGQTGRLCTGAVSYVWNSAALLTTGGSSVVKDSSATGQTIRLARVEDSGKVFCDNSSGLLPTELSGKKWSELLQGSSPDFAVHAMSMKRLSPSSDDAQALYQVMMTLGTKEAGTMDGTDVAVSCKPPTDNSANFDFCTVRSFDMVIRAGGGV